MKTVKQQRNGKREQCRVSLGNARQVRFQKTAEKELNHLAETNGTDFPTAVRIAVRSGLDSLREKLAGKAA